MTLSTTHRQILRLIAQGYDTEGIAEELGVSEYTVRSHVRRIKLKVAHPTARMPDLPERAREQGVVF